MIMKKIIKEKKLLNKKIFTATISNLSSYYQIFIDNLYGSNAINLESIFHDEGINIGNFLDLNNELTKNIYMILSSNLPNTIFSKDKLRDEKYINKLMEYISNNDDIKAYINNSVKKIIRNSENIVTKEIINEIFKKEDIVKKYDQDIIGIIIKNLSSECMNYLAKFYFKAEQDNFFADLLAIEGDKDRDGANIEEIFEKQQEKIKTYFKEFKIDKNDDIFKNEGQNFTNMDSRVFQKFYDKYPQVVLNKEEKKKIISYIQKLYSDEEYDFKQLFISMKLLIFFLSNNNLSGDQDLKIVINEKPDYLQIDEKCGNLFLENDIKINQFMDIFLYVEHLIFEELSKDLQSDYKAIITQEVVDFTERKLYYKKENEEITWEQLAAVVRRFISRNLIEKKKITGINEQLELEPELCRADLWEEKFRKLDDLKKLINEKIGSFKLMISQAFNFYKIIEIEERNLIFDKMKEINVDDPEENEIDV